MPPATVNTKRVVLAITGASGAIYARRLLGVLLGAGCEVHLSISPSGREVIAHELGVALDLAAFDSARLLGEWDGALPPVSSPGAKLHYHDHRDFMAPIASGSFLTDGMVICPC